MNLQKLESRLFLRNGIHPLAILLIPDMGGKSTNVGPNSPRAFKADLRWRMGVKHAGISTKGLQLWTTVEQEIKQNK